MDLGNLYGEMKVAGLVSMTKVMSMRLWGYIELSLSMNNGKPTIYHRVGNENNFI